MDYRTYAQKAHQTATYAIDPTEILIGAISEHGEVLEELKYSIRAGGEMTHQAKQRITVECGDVLWYIAEIARLVMHQQALEELAMLAQQRTAAYTAKATPLIAILKMSAAAGKIADYFADTLLSDGKLDLGKADNDFPVSQLVESLSWMMVLALLLNVPMTDVMQANIDKLAYRKQNGKEEKVVTHYKAA